MKWNKLDGIFNEDAVDGGLADEKTLADIAGHHGKPIQKIQAQYKQGMPVEKEHTDDNDTASEIVRDHLWEDPDYYTKLRAMEAEDTEE